MHFRRVLRESERFRERDDFVVRDCVGLRVCFLRCMVVRALCTVAANWRTTGY
jgi:hypothetical protein